MLHKDVSNGSFDNYHTYFSHYVNLLQIDLKVQKKRDQVLSVFIDPIPGK